MPACCWSAVASSRAGSFITRSVGRCAFRVMALSRSAWEAIRADRPSATPRLKRGSSMAEIPEVCFESRMLIDGKLVDGEAGTFTKINPATEEALGEVAD